MAEQHSNDPVGTSLRVIRSLNEHNVEYVVVGGVALNIWGIVRATEDLDIFVRPTVENIQRLRTALRAVWDDPEVEAISAEDLCGDYPAVRYGPPEGSLYLDILTRLGEFAAYDDLQFEVRDFGGVPVRVASPKTLYRLKKDTVRPIDHTDAAALRRAYDLDDEET